MTRDTGNALTAATYVVAAFCILGCFALIDVAYVSDIAIAILGVYAVACILLAPLGAAVLISATLSARRTRSTR